MIPKFNFSSHASLAVTREQLESIEQNFDCYGRQCDGQELILDMSAGDEAMSAKLADILTCDAEYIPGNYIIFYTE